MFGCGVRGELSLKRAKSTSQTQERRRGRKETAGGGVREEAQFSGAVLCNTIQTSEQAYDNVRRVKREDECLCWAGNINT